jgi:lipopolysaccharide export LptBFGC system permease protein LptF
MYYYALYDVPGLTIHDVSIFETRQRPLRLASHTMATRATFTGGRWRPERGWIQRFPTLDRSTREPLRHAALTLPPPDRFADLHNQETELMTFSQLRQHIQQLAASGINLAETRMTLQERVAFPMVALVMTLLGVPFGVTIGRRGALYGVGLAVVLGSVYWLANTFFVAIGQAALMPAVLAAWAANLLFLAGAAYLTLTVRT